MPVLTSVANFPQEIYESFIDALAETATTDKRSRYALVRCSNVCQIFWIRSRRYIFSDVRISGRIGRSRAGKRPSVFEQLADLLALTKTSSKLGTAFAIAGLIKSFTLDTTHEGRNIDRINSPVFAEILEAFVKAKVLHSLALRTNHISNWSEVKENARDSIYALCRTSHFKELSLPLFGNIPPSFFDNATIKVLTLRSLESPNDPLWSALSSPPQLDSLSVQTIIHNARLTHTGSSTTLPFHDLKILVCSINSRREVDAMYALARLSSHSLQRLELLFMLNTNILDQPFDFHHLPQLLHLKLGLTVADNVSRQIVDLCQFIPATIALKSATVQIDMSRDIRSSFDKVPWQTFDRALLGCHAERMDLILDFRPAAMFYGKGFYKSSIVKDTMDLIEPLLSKLKRNEEFTYVVDDHRAW